MRSERHFLQMKFNVIEISFFFFYFVIFRILADIEYNAYERHNYILFVKDMPERLIYGIVALVPFVHCYKFLIQGYLLRKKYGLFLLFLVLFLVFLNFYQLYSYWVISKLPFLPEGVSRSADIYYHSGALVHFSVIYISRELIVISFLAYFINAAKQDQLMNAIRERQLQAELKYLKVQLQPHFFFNTLNNIYSLTLERSASAAPLVAKLAEMMRYILYNSTTAKVPLKEEVAFLENYSQVEAVRFGEKISISFDKQGIRDGDKIEPLLLLPFIENAFKHGVGEETLAGYVRIIICVAGEELILEVRNSKAGKFLIPTGNTLLGNDRLSNGSLYRDKKGIGLENVRQRLSLLYPQKHRLVVNETETDFELSLTLQLNVDD